MKFIVTSLVCGLFAQGAFALTYDSRLPREVKTALEADLKFMKTIEGSDRSSRHGKIYGDLSGKDYVKFFNDRISKIGYAGEMGEGVMAFVRPLDPHTMWLTTNLVKYKAPQAWRVSTLWHESRHSESENGNWHHVNCPRNLKDQKGKPLTGPLSGQPLAGRPACDETADGAYGATATMFGNLAKFCTNCSEKFKADSELIFEDGGNRLVSADLRSELNDDLSN